MHLKERLKELHKKREPHFSEKEDNLRLRLAQSLNPHSFFLKKKSFSLEEVIEGRIVKTEFGEVFVKEHLTDIHSAEEDESMTETLQNILHNTSDGCFYKLCETVFIDVETMGLSGGVGNYAFLIGAGFFKDKQFIVKQFFLKEFIHEKAMLDLFELLLKKYKHMVTFNGKCFDIPLLLNRFVLCERETTLSRKGHTDLLYPSRVLWKDKLESLKFSSIERHILHKRRQCDIPGWMIPSSYVNFLNWGNTNQLERIFTHNLDDITGLMRLYLELSKRFHNPSSFRKTCFSATKYIYERHIDKAIPLLKLILVKSENIHEIYQAMKLLATYYKKKGDYEKAVAQWEKMIGLMPEAELNPFIELAKYFEHREKDYQKAKCIIDSIRNYNFSFDSALLHRQTRVERKLTAAGEITL